MLTLVEPCIVDGMLDRPHLGCAMLISSCRENGIKTTLIKGQTRYLRDIFVTYSDELWVLIMDLKDEDVKKLKIMEYKKFIREKGTRQFKAELKDLYQYVIVDKNPRHYFDAEKMWEFDRVYNMARKVYFYYLDVLNYSRLMIVNDYVCEIVNSNPRYIGFSLQDKFESLSRIIRKQIRNLTRIPIIAGGSLTPFINLEKFNNIFEKEFFDYLIVGAGEHALPSLINALENKKEPKGISNVFYKRDKKVISNELSVIDNLDSLPFPDYSQFDMDLYLTPKRILPLQTARGCSWRKCAFCAQHNIDFGNYRTFSTDKIIETIKYLRNKYNCSHFSFHDADLPPARARIISKGILDNKLGNIHINIYARPSNGYNDYGLFRLMRKSGFVLIHWGVESGCQRVLDTMNKGTEVSTISQILEKSSKNNIANLCFIFFGFPGEINQEAQQTVEFLKSHAKYIEEVSMGTFDFDLNSPIGKNPTKWHIDFKNGRYSSKNGMTPEELNAFYYKLGNEILLNNIDVTAGKLKYLVPGSHLRRMLHFLTYSHNVLSNMTALKRIKKRSIYNIFPIILGRVNNNNRIMLYPICASEPAFINKMFPAKGKFINSLEEKIFALSDGKMSIKDIILTTHRHFKSHYEKKYIYKKCITFFTKVCSKNLAIVFEKPWS